MPHGVEVVGGGGGEDEGGFEQQRDGSFALRVTSGTFLKMCSHLTGGSGGGGSGNTSASASTTGKVLLSDYTLTMDVLLPSLPNDSLALFQTSGE